MGLKSRTKGKVGERKAVLYLKELGFKDARRRQQSSGQNAAEVECLESLPNVHLEIKYGYGKGLGPGLSVLAKACIQASSDCGAREWAVLWREKGTAVWKLTLPSPNGIGVATYAGDDDIERNLVWLNGTR